MNRIISVSIVASVCMLVNACSSDAKADSEGDSTLLGAVVLHEAGHTAGGVFTSKSLKVIRTQDAYESELQLYTDDDPESPNFSEGVILVLDMGQRNTGGYSVSVISLEEADDSVTANVVLSKPGEECIVTQDFTNPFSFVWVPNTKELLVNESLDTYECN